MTQDSAYVATTRKKKGRKTERYIENDGGEGAKPVWFGGVAGSCTSGKEESRMEEFCPCPMQYLVQKGTMMMIGDFL